MEVVKSNLEFFADLTNDSDTLNISIKNNKITQNDQSWLRNNSVDGELLYNTIVWTFDNAVINFWEHHTTDDWLSELYREKYSLLYDAFVSLHYVYDKCKEHEYPNSIQDSLQEYDTELDTRLDIIYENCIEVCKPWEQVKNMVRYTIKLKNDRMDDNEYECLDPDSDSVEPEEENNEEKKEN